MEFRELYKKAAQIRNGLANKPFRALQNMKCGCLDFLERIFTRGQQAYSKFRQIVQIRLANLTNRDWISTEKGARFVLQRKRIWLSPY